MNQWLAAIIAGIVQAIVAILAKRSQRTAEDARQQSQLRDRLRREVRRTWAGKSLPMLAVLAMLIFSVGGCGVRTIYVPSGEPVRLRETIPGAKVWVLDESGKPVAGVMDLPEGWYCLPVPSEEK